MPGRIRVLFAGSSLRAEDVPDLARNCQCLVLTARNPQALEIAAKVEPELVLVDGAFACSQLPNVERVSLAMAHALQRLLIPTKSLLLAPGESYQYASWCHLLADMGRMWGKYYFKNMDDGSEFEVEIPEFQMIAPFKAN